MKNLVRLYLWNFWPSKEMNSPERQSEYMDNVALFYRCSFKGQK